MIANPIMQKLYGLVGGHLADSLDARPAVVPPGLAASLAAHLRPGGPSIEDVGY